MAPLRVAEGHLCYVYLSQEVIFLTTDLVTNIFIWADIEVKLLSLHLGTWGINGRPCRINGYSTGS